MKKNVLITGASGNLGKSTVDKFIASGYTVIATSTPGKTLPFRKSENLVTYEADLTNEAMVSDVVQKIISVHQTIDDALLLVGGFATGGVQETDGSLLRKMYSLNFETAYFIARPVFLQMLKQSNGGRIVLVGARPSIKANAGKGLIAYALAKSLLFKLAEFLNAEGASQNVVTSVVVPSTIDTPDNRIAMPAADYSAWVKPGQIADVLEFIASGKGEPLRDPVYKIYGKA